MSTTSNSFGSGTFGTQFGAKTSGSGKQIIDSCLRSNGIGTSDSVWRARALDMLNTIYFHVLQGKTWKFADREMFFDTRPPYELGTLALTQGGDTVTEDTATPVTQFNSTMKGQLFVPTQGDQGGYRIRKINSSTSLDLLPSYSGATAAASSYKILYDRIILDAAVQGIKSLSLGQFGHIEPVSLGQFRRMKYDNPGQTGAPQKFTVVDTEDDSGQLTLEFFPSPDRRYACILNYEERPVHYADSEDSFGLIPPQHIPALEYALRAEIYVQQNNAAMAQTMGNKAAMAYSRLCSDHAATDPRPRIQHGRKYFNRGHRGHSSYGLNWFPKVDD